MTRLKPFTFTTAFAAAWLLALPALANLGASESEESTNADWLAGKAAVEAKEWKTAAERLAKAATAEPQNADIQNWLGFSQRKLGNLDAAFAAYNEALRLNPSHKAAHEYIGEAYLQAGKVERAEKHLAELQRLCTPIPCEEYKDLKRAIEDYRKVKK
jgi:Flp pilus assembly protein TadD